MSETCCRNDAKGNCFSSEAVQFLPMSITGLGGNVSFYTSSCHFLDSPIGAEREALCPVCPQTVFAVVEIQGHQSPDIVKSKAEF